MLGERPGPNMHLGLDAEFVSLAPPEVEVRPDGTEVELRPARLTLARVSVVRADPGAKRLQPCIDDYIRAVEPVYGTGVRERGAAPPGRMRGLRLMSVT